MTLQNTGDPRATLEARSVRTADGCLEWTGFVCPYGYGQIKWERRIEKAHRLAYKAWRGEIAPRAHIHHRCGNKLCINPDHLEQLSPSEHRALHADVVRQPRKTHCKHGHAFTEESTYTYVLSTGKVNRCCRRCETIRKRAKRLGTTFSHELLKAAA